MLGLILILNSLRGLRRFYFRALPEHYIRDDGHITIDCPRCQSHQRATVQIHERWTAHIHTHVRTALTVYLCDQCHTQFNADVCTDDGAGIFTVNPWPCPLCQHLNPPGSHACQACGAGGQDIG